MIIYVSTIGNDVNDGLSESSPKKTINSAISAVSNGDNLF
jgi:hypothetical protein